MSPNGGHDTEVLIDGTQHADGRVQRVISIDDDNLTVAQARQLAHALMAAADEIDGWTVED
jgi:hypothetical protein